MTFPEIATQLARATGRTISYHDETLDEARASRASFGAPDWEVDGWISSYAAVATGELDVVSDTVSRLTRHEPQTLAGYLQTHPETYGHLLPA